MCCPAACTSRSLSITAIITTIITIITTYYHHHHHHYVGLWALTHICQSKKANGRRWHFLCGGSWSPTRWFLSLLLGFLLWPSQTRSQRNIEQQCIISSAHRYGSDICWFLAKYLFTFSITFYLAFLLKHKKNFFHLFPTRGEFYHWLDQNCFVTRSGVQLFWYFNADLIIHLAALNSFKIYWWVDPYLTYSFI